MLEAEFTMIHDRHRSIGSRRFAPLNTLWFVLLVAGCGAPQNQHVTTVATDAVVSGGKEKHTDSAGAESPGMRKDEPGSNESIAPVTVTGPAIGQYAPPITAEFVVGHGPVTLDEARGKVVIVDFWATFCAPCQKSFPKYQALLDQYGPDLAIIAVSVDDADTDREQLEQFAQMTHAKFPVVWDKDRKTTQAYRLPKIPVSFVIDKRGVIQHIHAGNPESSVDEIAREIRSLAGR